MQFDCKWKKPSLIYVLHGNPRVQYRLYYGLTENRHSGEHFPLLQNTLEKHKRTIQKTSIWIRFDFIRIFWILSEEAKIGLTMCVFFLFLWIFTLEI